MFGTGFPKSWSQHLRSEFNVWIAIISFIATGGGALYTVITYFEEAGAERAEVASTVKQNMKSVLKMDGKIDGLITDFSTARSTLDRIDSTVRSHSATLDDVKDRLPRLEQKVDDLKDRMDANHLAGTH